MSRVLCRICLKRLALETLTDPGVLPGAWARNQRLVDLGQDLAPSERLGQEGRLEGGQPVSYQNLGRMGRHVEDALMGPLLQHLSGDGYAVTLGHDHIDDEEIHPAPHQPQDIQRFGAVLGLEYAVSFLAEDAIGHPSRDSLIVDDQNGRRRTGEWRRQGGVLW